MAAYWEIDGVVKKGPMRAARRGSLLLWRLVKGVVDTSMPGAAWLVRACTPGRDYFRDSRVSFLAFALEPMVTDNDVEIRDTYKLPYSLYLAVLYLKGTATTSNRNAIFLQLILVEAHRQF